MNFPSDVLQMLRLVRVKGNRRQHLRLSGMDRWRKETLGLQVGNFIMWRDEAIELEGQPAVVSPGMRGEVISLHDGFHLDVVEVAPIPPKAVVQFESGMRLMVDERMKWEKASWLTQLTALGSSAAAVYLV